MRIRNKVDSDHHPVEVEIEGKRREKKSRQQGGSKKRVWNEERTQDI